MKGKLIKEADFYVLKIDDKIIGLSDEFLNNFLNYPHKLSIKNCLEIKHGFDLEDLAENKWNNLSKDLHFNLTEKALWCVGFQHGSVEFLDDKKFSLEDMKKAFEKGALKLGNNRYFDELIESLNKNEWNVEILMEKMNLDEIREQGKGFLNASTEKPKLDLYGCLILKKEA
jgi:hypothetical protein